VSEGGAKTLKYISFRMSIMLCKIRNSNKKMKTTWEIIYLEAGRIVQKNPLIK